MQLYIKPFRGLFKPTGLPRLDRSHPLCQGLVSCIAFSEGGGGSWDLVTGQYWSTSSGAKWSPDNVGLGYSPQGGSVVGLTPPTSVPLQNNSWSCLMLARPASADFSTFNFLMTLGHDAADSNGASFHIVGSKLAVKVNGSDQTNPNILSAGTLYAFGGGEDVGANGFAYVNGSYSTVSWAGPPNYGSTTTGVQIGGNGAQSGRSFNGNIYITLIYNWRIPQWMCDLFYNDPFSLLIYPEDDIFATLVGASAGGSTTLLPPSAAWGWHNATSPALSFSLQSVSKPWNWSGQAPGLSFNLLAASKAWNWLGQAPLLKFTLLAASKAWNWVGNVPQIGIGAITAASKAWNWLGNAVIISGGNVGPGVAKFFNMFKKFMTPNYDHQDFP